MSIGSYYDRTEVSRNKYSTVLNGVTNDELHEQQLFGCLLFGDRRDMLGEFGK
jgi:hypothetical protein